MLEVNGVVNDYAAFLAKKAQLDGDHGFDPVWMPDFLFPFQKHLTTWALRKGRAAIFSDCGTGKAPMGLVWASNVAQHTGKPVLVVAPLAVTFQLQAEAEKFGIDAATSRDGRIASAITITNYDRLHHFESDLFAGVVCDESSAIKAMDGQRRALVTEFLRERPYRLLCTATAAPNDYIELGTASEALGELGQMDMLARFFITDARTSKGYQGKWRVKGLHDWRFKGHAEDAFWRWVSSWARAMRRPSDFGFPDDGFVLLPLVQREHLVKARTVRPGMLFEIEANGLQEEREEERRTVVERCEQAAVLLADAEPGIAWCHRNDESALLAKLIPDAVEVKGGDDPDAKEAALIAFSRGEIRTLIIKPSIGAWGMNFQNCHRMTYFPSHSYELWYQAVRRCWRFGQQHPVTVDVVMTEGSKAVMANMARKATQADRMFDSLVAHMNEAMGVRRSVTYTKAAEVPSWV
jgi:hypothetical protein